MQAYTIQKNIGHSPRKMRLVADMVRKMSPEQAVEILKFTNKAAAIDLMKAIKTAMANAGGIEGLRFEKLEINEDMKLKRVRAGSKGRSKPYKKRFSQIKVVLSDGKEKDGTKD